MNVRTTGLHMAAGAIIALTLLLLSRAVTQAGAITSPITPAATAQPTVFPSPNGIYTATVPFYAGKIIITAQDGRTHEASWPKWISFAGWTPDSRFALFNYYDQYGNTWGHAFDTRKWTLIQITSILKGRKPCMPTMSGGCKEGVKSIAPDGKRIVLFDFTRVKVADLTK